MTDSLSCRVWLFFIPLLPWLALEAEAEALCFPLTPAVLPDGTRVECEEASPFLPPGTMYFHKNAQDYLQYSDEAEAGDFHAGEDWNGDRGGNTDMGASVHSIYAGTVVFIDDTSATNSWGKVVGIRHRLPSGLGGRTIYSLYGHLQGISSDIILGQPVSKGQQVGTLGDANGYYNSAHLHFEIQLSDRMDHCMDLTPNCIGDGYIDLHEAEELAARTHPEFLIAGSSKPLLERLPPAPHSPSPASGVNVTSLPTCDHEDGTNLGECLTWMSGENTVYWDVFFDDVPARRVYKPQYIFNFSFPQGSYPWAVTAYNFYGATTGPVWNLDYFLICTLLSVNGVASACEPPPTSPPSTTTTFATNVTDTSATLNGNVNPNGAETTVWFEYGIDGILSLGSSSQTFSAGYSTADVSITVGNLFCEETYSFRIAAQNSEGGSEGTVQTFSTEACTDEGSEPQPLIRNGDFSLDADFWSLSTDFHADRRFSNYNFGPGYAYLSEADGSPGNDLFGTLYQEFSIPANAESVLLTYWLKITTSEPSGGSAEDFLNATLQDENGNFLAHLRIYSNQNASSSYFRQQFDLVNFIGDTIRLHFLGTTDEGSPTVFRIDDVSVTATVPTGGPPSVTTGAVDQITDQSARVHLTVNPNGLSTDVWFDLEANDSTPNTDTEHVTVGSGNRSVSTSISVSGLDCDTTYFYEANASNNAGADDGSTKQFQTLACPGGPPRADTDPAVNITQTSAELTAEVDPNGLPTQAWFGWGTTEALGQETTRVSVGSGTGFQPFSQVLSGLSCGTTYHFENRVENSAGVDDGSNLSFTTLSCDPPPVTLFITKDGSGTGRVTTDPPGIDCGTTCSAAFDQDAFVTLIATADSGFLFLGWSGDPDCDDGVVRMLTDRHCTATLEPPPAEFKTLDVSKQGTGNGTVTSDPPGIDCGSDCSEEYSLGQQVELFLSPDPDSVFAGWIFEPDCQDDIVSMDANRLCVARFDLINRIFSDGFESGDTSAWSVVTRNADPPSEITLPLTQGQPGSPGKDIWTTSVFSYAPGGGGPGGGLDNHALVVGGWGDLYYALLQFNLSGISVRAQRATLELFPFQNRSETTTGLYVDRVTSDWDWRIQGTGSDHERLWWSDRPSAVQWAPTLLSAPQIDGWYSIDITELYNSWIDGSVPNFGVQLRPAQNPGNNTWSEFYSANADDPILRPRLVIVPLSEP